MRARRVGVRSGVGSVPERSLTLGLPRSTVQVRAAGLASVLPAPSVARTLSSCSPWASLLTVVGDEHDAHAPPSRLHSKVLPGSEEAKVKVAAGPRAWLFGPLVMVVSGGVVSPGPGSSPVTTTSTESVVSSVPPS